MNSEYIVQTFVKRVKNNKNGRFNGQAASDILERVSEVELRELKGAVDRINREAVASYSPSASTDTDIEIAKYRDELRACALSLFTCIEIEERRRRNSLKLLRKHDVSTNID